MALSCAAAVQHSDNMRVQMLMKEACTMLQRPGDWETCAKMFSSIIEEDPLYAEVRRVVALGGCRPCWLSPIANCSF